uniref:OB domain-containing protein n=1 Tax=Chromera velia CCMP2878 TaxID=1169474 RepID=A0A0G4FUX3_9ALVE|mmetsp:Transcript_33400/g.66234  ORF Transcript_33400/g.66234 Transcript_33400/m.66234 type:complete len:184 (-) Transcript_33400:74-625(-)|eukprot:Cvel_18895.t1-p1 / transcript=Cvel_18895.t1 / gene=Cvel_18895 / organism=Chromera_velia_CCMP2878 / gene_product=hypothetical protein / transcript_product=hypothetical protein / location=Cvel_scaffold1592:18996-20285(-) / protein_length=183 / sequence_SO=supercontig / SO=protein_coding / is_pseudo=false
MSRPDTLCSAGLALLDEVQSCCEGQRVRVYGKVREHGNASSVGPPSPFCILEDGGNRLTVYLDLLGENASRLVKGRQYMFIGDVQEEDRGDPGKRATSSTDPIVLDEDEDEDMGQQEDVAMSADVQRDNREGSAKSKSRKVLQAKIFSDVTGMDMGFFKEVLRLRRLALPHLEGEANPIVDVS